MMIDLVWLLWFVGAAAIVDMNDGEHTSAIALPDMEVVKLNDGS